MSTKRYMEELKIGAVQQVVERSHPVSEVAERLGVSIHSLYAWMKRYRVPEPERQMPRPKKWGVCWSIGERCEAGLARWNHKRVYRVMKAHGLLLPKSPRKQASSRPHDGKVAVTKSNRRWSSHGFEIACDNGEVVTGVFGGMPLPMVEEHLRHGRLVTLELEMDPLLGPGFTMRAVHRLAHPPGPAGRWLIDQLRQAHC